MRSLRLPLLVLTGLLLVLAAGAQSNNYRAIWYAPFAPLRPGITGAPYSSEQTFDSIEVAPNGTRITRAMTEYLYRDAQGRRRTERRMFPERDTRLRLVQIADPVSGHEYVVDVVNRVAHRFRKPPSSVATDGALNLTALIYALSWQSSHSETLNPRNLTRVPPEVTTQTLGQRAIDGLLTQGIQTTKRYSAGSLDDGRPFTVRTEAWVSEERKVLVLSKRNDSRNSESVTRLVNYKPGEPDAALFQPPLNYTIVNEDGTFSINIAFPEK